MTCDDCWWKYVRDCSWDYLYEGDDYAEDCIDYRNKITNPVQTLLTSKEQL
jgi:hypothetical protein